MQFNIGKSGGVSYTWDFGDGYAEGDDAPTPSVSHTYDARRHQDGDAEGDLRRRRHGHQDRRAADVPTPLFTNVYAGRRGERAAGAVADARHPGHVRRLHAVGRQGLHRLDDRTRARHQRRRAADRRRPVATATGHLVNGDYTLPSALQVKATSAIGTGGAAFANVGGTASPTPLLTYPRALNDAAITLDFKQHVGATDALRAGRYSKTLTFTLATTAP